MRSRLLLLVLLLTPTTAWADLIVPPPSAPPSGAPSSPAPPRGTEVAIGREGSKSCSCSLPGTGAPGEQRGLAAVLVLVGLLAVRPRG